MKNNVIKNLIIAMIVFITLMIICNMLLIIDSYTDLKFVKYKPFVVLTKSMSPMINKGDLAVVKKTNIEHLDANDIIVFSQDNVKSIRKITKIKSETILVKSNIESEDDSYSIPKENTFEKYVFKIGGLGYIVLFLQSIYGFIFVILLILFLFYLYFKSKNEDDN